MTGAMGVPHAYTSNNSNSSNNSSSNSKTNKNSAHDDNLGLLSAKRYKADCYAGLRRF